MEDKRERMMRRLELGDMDVLHDLRADIERRGDKEGFQEVLDMMNKHCLGRRLEELRNAEDSITEYYDVLLYNIIQMVKGITLEVDLSKGWGPFHFSRVKNGVTEAITHKTHQIFVYDTVKYFIPISRFKDGNPTFFFAFTKRDVTWAEDVVWKGARLEFEIYLRAEEKCVVLQNNQGFNVEGDRGYIEQDHIEIKLGFRELRDFLLRQYGFVLEFPDTINVL